jgi:hypothetical protein
MQAVTLREPEIWRCTGLKMETLTTINYAQKYVKFKELEWLTSHIFYV